jgi:hypothetical protein
MSKLEAQHIYVLELIKDILEEMQDLDVQSIILRVGKDVAKSRDTNIDIRNYL